MPLISNLRYTCSLFLAWAFYFVLFYGKGIVLPLVGTLLYLGISHYLVQYWFALFFLVSKKQKSEGKFYWFPLIALLAPGFLVASIYQTSLYDLNILSVVPFILAYCFIFLSLRNIFDYFSSMNDPDRWGTKEIMNMYFSRFPPVKRSDMLGMDVFLFFIIALLLGSFFM